MPIRTKVVYHESYSEHAQRHGLTTIERHESYTEKPMHDAAAQLLVDLTYWPLHEGRTIIYEPHRDEIVVWLSGPKSDAAGYDHWVTKSWTHTRAATRVDVQLWFEHVPEHPGQPPMTAEEIADALVDAIGPDLESVRIGDYEAPPPRIESSEAPQ